MLAVLVALRASRGQSAVQRHSARIFEALRQLVSPTTDGPACHRHGASPCAGETSTGSRLRRRQAVAAARYCGCAVLVMAAGVSETFLVAVLAPYPYYIFSNCCVEMGSNLEGIKASNSLSYVPGGVARWHFFSAPFLLSSFSLLLRTWLVQGTGFSPFSPSIELSAEFTPPCWS